MADPDRSTLWPVSEYRRMLEELARAEEGTPARQTVLSATLRTELRDATRHPEGADLIEVFAACRRHAEPLLVCLRHHGLVWPVTVFPAEMTYHSPRDVLSCTDLELAQFKVLAIEPAVVRPPGHWMHERIAEQSLYRPLGPMLWAVALRGPSRSALVPAISGTAAFRVTRSLASDDLSAPGALGAAVERLRREPASLRAVSEWPGMSLERGVRLLNALHLVSNLMVTRTHPAARPEPRAAQPARRL
jgi:hypothetical protein